MKNDKREKSKKKTIDLSKISKEEKDKLITKLVMKAQGYTDDPVILDNFYDEGYDTGR